MHKQLLHNIPLQVLENSWHSKVLETRNLLEPRKVLEGSKVLEQ